MKVQGYRGTEVSINVAESTMNHLIIASGVAEVSGMEKGKVSHSQGTEFYVDGMRVPAGHYWQSGKIRPVMGKPKASKGRKRVRNPRIAGNNTHTYMKSLEVHFAVCDYPTGTNTTEKRIVQVHFLEDGTKVMQTAPIGWKVVSDDQWNAMKRYDFSEAPHFAP